MQPPIETQAPPPPEPALATVQAPAPPVRQITTVGPDGKPHTFTVPRSVGEVRELLAQRDELAGQLSNVTGRRRSLAAELAETHDPPARAGLESRLALLDQRILQIETDLAITGRQLSSAPTELVAITESRDQGDDNWEEGFFTGGFSGLCAAVVIIFFARRRWKRKAPSSSQLGADSAPRLERLEHGMDAIALEIERISEGQRFVTKLLSEAPSPIGQPQRLAKPVPVEREDPAKR